MRTLLPFIFSVTILISISNGTQGQVVPGDFIHGSSISDQLKAPNRIAIDQQDHIYVTDSYNKCILRYDASGIFLSSISINGKPVSLAINNNNELFAGDGNTGQILKVNADGTTQLFYTGCVFPNSMTFSPDGHLYVSDSRLNKVLVINASGELVQTIGEGTLIFPTGIAFDSKNNHLIVGIQGAVEGNLQTRIYIYNTSGTLVTSFGSYGYTDGRFYRVQGIASGRCGNIYVCEPFQGNVSVFSESGTFITKFGSFGTEAGELNVPMDVAFDSQERIVLASMNNGALEIFTIQDLLPSASIPATFASLCEGENTQVPVHFTGTPPWTFTYTRDNGNPVTVNNVSDNPYQLILSQAGTYKITALSDANHVGSCFSGGATLEVNPLPTAVMVAASDSICEGQTADIPVLLTGTPPWTLEYIHNDQAPVPVTANHSPFLLKVSEPGSYVISSVSDAFCTGSYAGSIFNLIVLPRPFPGFSYASNYKVISFMNTSTGFTSCYWNFGDGQTSTETNPVHKYLYPGIYSVSLYAWNNECKARKITKTVIVSNLVIIDALTETTDVQSADGILSSPELTVNLFPNPSEGLFSLEMGNFSPTDLSLEVFNAAGQLVMKKYFSDEVLSGEDQNFTEQLDLSQYANGIYTLKIITPVVIKTVKLVLNR